MMPNSIEMGLDQAVIAMLSAGKKGGLMIDYLWMWSELIVRWVHVIAGIAWIGSSFYFIALDLSLKPGKGIAGRGAWPSMASTWRWFLQHGEISGGPRQNARRADMV
jgi:hypothetical protein